MINQEKLTSPKTKGAVMQPIQRLLNEVNTKIVALETAKQPYGEQLAS